MSNVIETIQTIAKLLSKNNKNTSKSGFISPTPLLDARILCAHVMGIDPGSIIMHYDQTVNAEQQHQIDALVQKRQNGMPIAYIIGYRDFWKDRFMVNEDTLIPRPDSEIFIETSVHIFDKTSPKSILDLGTGSGCLLLSLLREFPKAHGIGIDYSRGALDIAQKNAEKIIAKSVSAIEMPLFLQGSWFDALKGLGAQKNTTEIPKKFDLIVANPPYIDPGDQSIMAYETLHFEPKTALFSGNKGEKGINDYQLILSKAATFLNQDGYLLLELNEQYVQTLIDKVINAPSMTLVIQDIVKDLAGHKRLMVLKKG